LLNVKLVVHHVTIDFKRLNRIVHLVGFIYETVIFIYATVRTSKIAKSVPLILCHLHSAFVTGSKFCV